MGNPKPITKTKRKTVAGENKAFVKTKVKSLYATFVELYDDFVAQNPDMMKDPRQLLRLQHIFYGNIAPNTDEIIALRGLVKEKLQSQINTL